MPATPARVPAAARATPAPARVTGARASTTSAGTVHCSAGPCSAAVEASAGSARAAVEASAGSARAAAVEASTAVESPGPCVSSARSKTTPWAARTAESTVNHSPAAGEVSAAVKEDAVTPPSHSPVAPSPSKATPQADPDPDSKADPQAAEDNSRRRIVVIARKWRERSAPNRPWVVDRNIDHRRVSGRDHNLAAVVFHRLLRRAAQLTGSLRLLAHRLH